MIYDYLYKINGRFSEFLILVLRLLGIEKQPRKIFMKSERC